MSRQTHAKHDKTRQIVVRDFIVSFIDYSARKVKMTYDYRVLDCRASNIARGKTAPTKSPSKPTTRVMQCASQRKTTNVCSLKIISRGLGLHFSELTKPDLHLTAKHIQRRGTVSVFEQAAQVCFFRLYTSVFIYFLLQLNGYMSVSKRHQR